MPGQWTRRLGSCSSQARRISTAPRQSTTKHVTPLKGEQLGPTRQHDHQTFRARKDGKKELPLPPLLDPVVIEDRSRHEKKKQKPQFADFTPFQRKLWENPFGMLNMSSISTLAHTTQPTPSPRPSVNAVHPKSSPPKPSSPLCTSARTPRPAIPGSSPSP